MSKQMVDAHLTQSKVSIIVQQIIRSVLVLKEYYLTSKITEKGIMLKHLRDSYIYECQKANRIISVDEYINDIEKSIGWDWVLPG